MANPLPTVGGDSGTWGQKLNDFLSVEHTAADGTHKMGVGLVTENVNTVASSGASQTIPAPSTQTLNDITLSTNCTITLPTPVAGQSFTLILRQSNPAGQTVSWTGTVKWPLGIIPVLSTAAHAIDVLAFFSPDGVSWFGYLALQNVYDGAISFNGDWSAGLFGAANTWEFIARMAVDRITLVSDVKRRYANSARFLVGPGDDPTGNPAYENAQVSFPLNASGVQILENESSGTQYYGTSVRLDSAFPDTPSNSWAVVVELHGPDSYATNPAFQLECKNNTLGTQTWCIGMRGGDLDSVLSVTHYALSNATLNKGFWTDFIFKIKYAKDNTGSVDVWRRDEGETNFVNVLSLPNIATLQYKSSISPTPGDHYWKTGFYRHADTTTAILHIDGFIRGSTYDIVSNTY